jgi:hypothetical protein
MASTLQASTDARTTVGSPLYWGTTDVTRRAYGARVRYPDDVLDEDALAANRTDHRRATVLTVVSFVVVIVASALVVVAGIPGA